MLQRVQSIFLLLVAMVMITVMFLPIWSKTGTEGTVTLNVMELTYVEDGNLVFQKDTFYIAILCVLASGIAFFSIFQYSNRLRQMQMNTANSLCMGIVLGLTYYYTAKGNALMDPETQGTFHIGFYIIAAAMLFNSLANRFIRKDEQLVRSADRIR